jgi:hypothetical protein
LAKTYPPKFNKDFQYPQEYNLDKLPMPGEDVIQGTYFSVNFPPDSNNFGTNSTLSFGKHYFKIHFNPQPVGLPRLKAGSQILFEFKDAENISGKRRVIFSDVTPLKGSSSYFIGYVWLKEDPMRTYQSLVGGTGTLTIVGTTETTNPGWSNKHNIRTTIPFGIDLSDVNNNTSPILLQETSSSIETGIFISESIESYKNIPSQSFAHISASMLKTYGGEISQTKLSFVLSSSFETGRENYGLNPRNAIYTDLSTHIMGTGTTVNYENDIDSTYSEGINPESEIWKVAIPPGLTGIPAGPLPDDEYSKVKFKLTLTNSENSIAQDLYGKNSTGLSIMYPTGSNSWLEFTGSSAVITGPKNLMSGELIIGTSPTDGVVMGTNTDDDGNRILSFQEIVAGVKGTVLTTIGKTGIINNEGNNQVLGSTGTNISGLANRAINANNSTIFSALSSSITGSERATILAGKNNSIEASPQSTVIGSEDSTLISGSQVIVIGGEGNLIQSTAAAGAFEADMGQGNIIVGGKDNTISGSYTWRNIILGGADNQMLAVGHYQNINIQNAIVGGDGNIIHSGEYSFIGGGRNHTIAGKGHVGLGNFGFDNALIAGNANHISGGVKRSVVIGGTGISASLNDTVYVPNLNVQGSLTATSITSSIVSSSTIFLSGSNIFGDTIDDTHQFFGHITASGNISGSSTSTINVGGNITSLGTTLTLQNVSAPKVVIKDTSNNFALELEQGNGSAFIRFDDHAAQDLIFQSNVESNHMVLDSGTGFTGVGGLTSANIFSTLHVGGDLKVNSHITASGNISSSGDLYSNKVIVGGASGSVDGLTVAGDISASGDIYTDNGQAFLGGGRLNTAALILTDLSNDYSSSLIQGTLITSLKLNQNANQDFSIDTNETDNNFYIDGTYGYVGIKTSIPSKALTVVGDISASGDLYFNDEVSINKGLNITGNITATGNLYAKTFKSEKIKAFFLAAADNSWYYFPIGPNPYASVQDPGSLVPLSGFQATAMCDLSITRLKLTFFYAVTNMGTLSMKLQKYDGSGDPDAAGNWGDVGTTWTVASADLANGARAYHAPSDWAISAGENYILAFNSNTSGGQNNVVWINGGITIEEDWNNPVTS